jgi:hypothetical protein
LTVPEINELKNQLFHIHNLGFLFGAGTSCAFGLPGIVDLTNEVKESLDDDLKDDFNKIINNLEKIHSTKSNIEDILNHVRQIRDITNDKIDYNFHEINGEIAKKIDLDVCVKINEILTKKEKEVEFDYLTV